MKVLILSASPREDGNSHLLARAAGDGARSSGHDVEHLFLDVTATSRNFVKKLPGKNTRTVPPASHDITLMVLGVSYRVCISEKLSPFCDHTTVFHPVRIATPIVEI